MSDVFLQMIIFFIRNAILTIFPSYRRGLSNATLSFFPLSAGVEWRYCAVPRCADRGKAVGLCA